MTLTHIQKKSNKKTVQDEPITALSLATNSKTEHLENLFSDESAEGGKNKSGYTALSIDAWHGNLDSLKELLAQGVDIDEINPDGSTALMIAALAGENVDLSLIHI